MSIGDSRRATERRFLFYSSPVGWNGVWKEHKDRQGRQ